MKRKNNNVVHNQKEVDEIMNESKKKKKNSKGKESKANKTDKKDYKKIFFIIPIVLVVVVIVIISCLTIKANTDKVIVRDQVVLESGTSTKDLEKRFIEKRGNLEIKKIEYTNTNKNVKNKKELATVEVYLDSKGNEVDRDEACDKKGTEEKPEYVLKKGYTKDVRLIDVYIYDVKIYSKDGRTFKSKLVLEDTKAPKLIAKETVEVIEGDEIKADMFLEKYEDSSNRTHGDLYFVKEVKAKSKDTSKKNKASKYEKYELTDEDKLVGEHELLVVVEDPSKNVSEPTKVKLIVKEKPVEEPEEIATGGNTGYSGGSRSGGTYRRSSGGYSGGNSGGSAGGASSGPLRTSGGTVVSQNQLFAYWGPGGYSSARLQSALNQMNSMSRSVTPGYLAQCNAHFGDNKCIDWMGYEEVYDGNMNSVGIYVPYSMTHCPDNSTYGYGCPKVGNGYILPSGAVWLYKNY